jgi:hypothetical protein
MASIGVASWIDPLKATAASTEPGPVNYSEKLGVEPINAAGTYTALSAAVMPPSVQAALPRQPNTRCASKAAVRRCGSSGIALRNAKLVLQLLKRDPFGFRIDEQDDKELQRRHGRKECEGQSAGIFCEYREDKRDDRVHQPV